MVPLRIDHSTLAIPSRMWLTSEYMVRTELKKVRGLLTSLEKGALSRIFSLPTAEMAQGLCIEVTGSQRTHLATFQIRIHICKSNSNMWKCLGLESIWFILYDVFVLFVTKFLRCGGERVGHFLSNVNLVVELLRTACGSCGFMLPPVLEGGLGTEGAWAAACFLSPSCQWSVVQQKQSQLRIFSGGPWSIHDVQMGAEHPCTCCRDKVRSGHGLPGYPSSNCPNTQTIYCP